jgi:hypothetical protein
MRFHRQQHFLGALFHSARTLDGSSLRQWTANGHLCSLERLNGNLDGLTDKIGAYSASNFDSGKETTPKLQLWPLRSGMVHVSALSVKNDR